MSKPLIMTVDARGVCTLTLNRPEKHNALNKALINALREILAKIDSENGIRVVVITGNGLSFSSGADLEWMRESARFNDQENRQDAEQLANLMRSLYELSKPTIARVNGHAFGGALGLIACCDIAIAHCDAQFAFTEVRLGLTPAIIAPYILLAMGSRQVRRLFLTAERFSSKDALQFGLIHHLASEDSLDSEVQKQIKNLLQAGPVAIGETKKLLRQLTRQLTPNEPNDETLAALIARLRTSAEGQEGLRAFHEKRSPTWCK